MAPARRSAPYLWERILIWVLIVACLGEKVARPFVALAFGAP